MNDYTTEQEQLEYINKECKTNYTSLEEVEWQMISKYQKLSEDFIIEFQDKLNWQYISEYQKLSKEFLREFKDRIDWNIFFCRNDIKQKLIDFIVN